MKLAITGRPGSGKTTLVRRLVEALRDQYVIGGIYTQELRDERGRRVGFEILDLTGGGRGLLAHIEIQQGPKVGKYRVSVQDVERVAVPAIERALREAHLVVIDEVAPMELTSPKFIAAVERALTSHKPLIVTFQRRSQHPLVQRIRRECEVHEITPSNRERLFQELLAKLRSALASSSS